MKQNRIKKVECKYLALAFGLPCIGMLLVMLIGRCEPFGNNSMFIWDTYHQYYPFFVEFRSALREGKGLLYTWSVGLGMDYLGLIAYYLTSPLNLFSVLVPDRLLLEYFSVLVPVKFGFAGLFFAVFLKEIFEKNDVSISVFGGFYALCAWALGFQGHIMWLDTFALVPLVVLGTVRLLRDKKYILYTVTLFLSLYFNYYIGLFVCYFVFLLFFIYEFCRWGGWKKFLQDFGRIAVFSLLAIGMVLFLALPAVGGLQSSQASVSEFPRGFQLTLGEENTLRGLLNAMRQVAGNMSGSIKPTILSGLPNISCGIISVFLMMLYLLAKNIQLRDKLSAFLLLCFFNASFIISQLDYIWHGFHFTNSMPYRFSFLYSFVVLYMAYRAWTLRDSFSVKQVMWAGLMSAAVFVFSDNLTSTVHLGFGSIHLDFPLFFLYNFCILALYVTIMLAGCFRKDYQKTVTEGQTSCENKVTQFQKHQGEILLMVGMALELIAVLFFFYQYLSGINLSDYPKGTEHTASVIRFMEEQETENLFYRVETTHTQTLNDGAVNGYNGISGYTSTTNRHATEFMESLGYSATNILYIHSYEESSPVANLFLGLKYMIDLDDKDKTSTFFAQQYQSGPVTLLENRAYLPLAFLAEPELAKLKFTSSQNVFEFQNRLFTAATGVEKMVWHQIPGNNLTIGSQDVIVADQNGIGDCSYEDAGQNSSLVYRFVADRDGFACLYLNFPNLNTYYVSVNGEELYKESTGTHERVPLPQMTAVDDVTAGDVIEVRVICKSGESGTMTIEAAIMDHDVFWQGYEILKASTLELTTFESTYVKGMVSCNRDGLLYASIPQNGNWEVKVDGKPAEIHLVGDCMVGVMLTEGQHMVEYIYHNQLFTIGWIISLSCAAIFGILVYKQLKPQKRRTKQR